MQYLSGYDDDDDDKKRTPRVYSFCSMTTVAEVKALDAAGGINRKLENAAKKDTVTIPDGGYVVIRFTADNPGWLLILSHPTSHLAWNLSSSFFIFIHLRKEKKNSYCWCYSYKILMQDF